MTIEINSATPPPNITYDRIHMVMVKVNQSDRVMDAQQPVYRMSVSYKLYGLDGNGKIYYLNNGGYRITIPDFLVEAILQAQQGNNDLLAAIQSIESALVTVINDKGTHGTVVSS